MKVVVAGASGLVGSELIQALIQDPYFSQVTAVTRKPISITNVKLKNVICKNFDQLELLSDELNGEIYFCCLGSTIKKSQTKENFKKIDYDAVINFAQIAKTQDASKFIMISASGANPNSLIFYNKIKGQAETGLINLNLNSLLIYRPGLLIGKRTEKRFAEKLSIDILTLVSPLIPKNIEKLISTKVGDLCESMLKECKLSQPPLKIIEAKDI